MQNLLDFRLVTGYSLGVLLNNGLFRYLLENVGTTARVPTTSSPSKIAAIVGGTFGGTIFLAIIGIVGRCITKRNDDPFCKVGEVSIACCNK